MRQLVLVFIFIPCILLGQDILFSEDYAIKSDVAYYLIDDLDGSFILFRDIPKDRKIHIMDDKMMDAGESAIEFEYKNPLIHDVVKAREDQFSVIYTAKKKGDRFLRIENFDKYGQMKDSLTIDVVNGLFDAVNYEIEKSDDETKMLIYHINFDKTIDAIMVDIENLKVLWKHTLDNLGIKQFFQIKQFIVSNDADFCLVTLMDNSNLNRKKARFELHTVKRNPESLKTIKVPMKEKLSASSKFVFDKLNNSLVGTGLYSDKNTIRSHGVFHIKVPLSDPENHKISFNPFSEDFTKEFLQKKSVGSNTGISSTEIQDIVLRKDGGVLMIGERIETKLRGAVAVPFRNSNQDGIKADYYYDQVFVSSIHPDGKEHWTEIIQKKQYSFDDGGIYSSFYKFVSKNGLHLLFNDEVRNHSTISDFTIKGNGKYKRRAILNTIGVDIKLRIRDALQTSANEIIVPSQYRNKLRMVKFNF